MNRVLIGILDLVNKLLALFLVISGIALGYLGDFHAYLRPDLGPTLERIVSTALGFLAGLVSAALVCGVIASQVAAVRELREIRDLMVLRGPPRSI